LRLLRDEDLRIKMGRRGRELAIERYSTEKVIPQYISLYERVIGGVRAAAR
jgi:glycosyltransferase involved in cell wall biosynthesis